MRLLRAEFQNFRLLRDLELRFSSDPDRCLTVIRAANESGKTAILHALQWALYGDEGLPGKGEGFRLDPIDWDASDGKRVPIMVSVEFELTTYRRRRTARARRADGTALSARRSRKWTPPASGRLQP
jgi:DNA sulfur modification protein DndD